MQRNAEVGLFTKPSSLHTKKDLFKLFICLDRIIIYS